VYSNYGHTEMKAPVLVQTYKYSLRCYILLITDSEKWNILVHCSCGFQPLTYGVYRHVSDMVLL
jgi:hypothetical protein